MGSEQRVSPSSWAMERAAFVSNAIITSFSLPKLGFCQCSDLSEAVFEASTKGVDPLREMLQGEGKPVLDVIWAQFAAGASVSLGTAAKKASALCEKTFAEQYKLAQRRAKDEVIEMLIEHRMDHVKALVAWRRCCDKDMVVTFDVKRRDSNDRAPWMRRV